MYAPFASVDLYPGSASAASVTEAGLVSSEGASAGASVRPADEAASRSSTEVFPVYGNTSEFNINKLLYNNILQCDYFKGMTV